MPERLQALRELLENPSSNPAALGAAVAIVVVIVVVLALVLIVLALPSRTEPDEEEDRAEQGGELPAPRPSTSPWVSALATWVLVVTSLALGVVIFYESTSSDAYCTRTCHAMAEPAATHAASAHKSIGCVRCHEGRKWETMWGGLASRSYSIYLQYSIGQARVTNVPSRRCLECHTAAMSIQLTARNGEQFRHVDLGDAGSECERCHGAQGHELPTPR